MSNATTKNYSVHAHCGNCKRNVIIVLTKGTVRDQAAGKPCPTCGITGKIRLL